jgi:hypothetical protein
MEIHPIDLVGVIVHDLAAAKGFFLLEPAEQLK